MVKIASLIGRLAARLFVDHESSWTESAKARIRNAGNGGEVITALSLAALMCVSCSPKTPQEHTVSQIAQPADKFTFLQFTRGRWERANVRTLPRHRHALLLMHGVLEDINSSFPPVAAAEMQRLGKYDAVYGISYDWSQPVSQVAPKYAAVLDNIPASQIDVEGHSYGAIQTLAGVERSRVIPGNVILLGAPLGGTPLAERTFFSRALLQLPDDVWNGNIARFRRMRDSGATVALAPDSGTLNSILSRFFFSERYRNSHVILVAGDNPNRMGLISNVYMRVFSLECFFCGLAGDGVIPTSSATANNYKVMRRGNIFATNVDIAHAVLKNDREVIHIVASHLVDHLSTSKRSQ